MRKGYAVAYAVAAFFILGAGGRLIYTELARSDMINYIKSAEEIHKNAALKAKWNERVRQIDAYWERKAPEPTCSPNAEIKEKRVDDNVTYKDQITNQILYGESDCAKVNEYVRELREEGKLTDKNKLGFYEDWALKQSGINDYHRWMKYPQELRERVMKGERGLMLGKFWEYIL